MKKWVAALVVIVGTTSFTLGTGVVAQQSVPEIPFDTDMNFLKLPPDMNFGEVSGIAVNSKGQIAAFTRNNSASGPAYGATASQVLLFDANGKFLREVGKGLYAWSYSHTVRFDKDDNLWAIDKGSDMIVRFNPEGRVTMVFGRKKEASDESAEPWTRVTPPRPPVPGQFRQPTDVAWDAQGNIYISDGYVNSRVAKFTKDGDWVTSIGEPGKGPGQLNTPHSIANDAKGNIYVADRGNRRIQVIDPNTNKFVREIRIDVPAPPDAKPWMGEVPNVAQMLSPDAPAGSGPQAPGAPWAICVTPPNAQGVQYLYSADSFPGRVYKLTLDGKVLGWLGGAGHRPKQFGWIHEIACPSENTIYVGELLNWRAQKITMHPTPAMSSSGQ